MSSLENLTRKVDRMAATTDPILPVYDALQDPIVTSLAEPERSQALAFLRSIEARVTVTAKGRPILSQLSEEELDTLEYWAIQSGQPTDRPGGGHCPPSVS